MEQKESICARYLLSYAFENFNGLDQLEMVYLVDKLLFGTEKTFADGHKLIHKVVRYAKPIVLKEMTKLGYDLEQNTKTTSNIIPRKFLPISVANFS